LLAAAVTIAAQPAAGQSRQPWRLTLAASTQQGDYGTTTQTTTESLTVALRRTLSEGDVTLTAPVLWITTQPAGGAPSTASGLSDIRITGRYFAWTSRDYQTLLNAVGEVKLPTGDSKRGLGSGAMDETFGVEWTRMLTRAHFVFADVAYTLVGDPPKVNLYDQFRLSLGGGTFFTDRLVGSVAFEERTPAAAGLADSQEVIASLVWSGPIGLQGAVNIGLSNAAPDHGMTVGMFVKF
jgi:hypothetical protein